MFIALWVTVLLTPGLVQNKLLYDKVPQLAWVRASIFSISAGVSFSIHYHKRLQVSKSVFNFRNIYATKPSSFQSYLLAAVLSENMEHGTQSILEFIALEQILQHNRIEIKLMIYVL
jgi:hypothetical protein